MTHNGRASAQHQCGELAIGRVNTRVRRSNSSVGAACCWHGSLTPETASVLVNVMGQLRPLSYRASKALLTTVDG